MICMRKKKMLSPRQYAEAIGKPYSTVMTWLQKGMIPAAQREAAPPPFTGHIYLIPQGTKPPDIKPGRKPKAKKKPPTS